MQEHDSPLRNKRAFRTIVSRCAKRGPGRVSTPGPVRTLPGLGRQQGDRVQQPSQLCILQLHISRLETSATITEKVKTSGPRLSSSYKKEFKGKASRCEASLILGASPSAGKTEIGTVRRKIMISN